METSTIPYFTRSHHRCSRFVTLAIAAVVSVAIASCEVLDPNPGPAPFDARSGRFDTLPTPIIPLDTVPPSISRGAELFAQNCARCHGEDGSDGGAIFEGSIQGKKGLHLIVREGRGSMPGFPRMSDNQISSLEQFLDSLKGDLGDLGGEDLYLFYCAGCHGADALGADPYSGSIRGYEPVHDVIRDGIGKMPSIDITSEESDKIQEFLLALREDLSTLSGEEYYARVCASCHGKAGEGNWRGPEIRNPVSGYSTWVVRNGRVTQPLYELDMPKYDADSLSEEQWQEILTWLQSAEKPFAGKDLYNRFCSTCHGFDGTGGPSQEDITGEDIDEFFGKIREGEGGTRYAARRDYMPSRSRSQITDAEIRRIAEWIMR